MTHGSKLAQIEAAFGALGKRLVVGVEDVAAVRLLYSTRVGCESCSERARF
jgi:hypothetical protein